MGKRGNPNWGNKESGNGKSGNPLGGPRKPEIEMFREAIAEVEAEKGTTLLKHAVEQSFKSEAVLIALLKKILPDKIEDDRLKELVRTFLVRSK